MRALAVVAAIALASCSKAGPRPDDRGPGAPPPPPPRAPVTAPTAKVTLAGANGPVEVEVEVVQSPRRIQRGLMYRKEMAPMAGMLFLMGDNTEHHFWMHNTLIGLDIMFIGADRRVVGILEDMRPLDDTSRSVGAPSLYVLEVNAGFSKRHGIGPGTEVTFGDVESVAQ